MQLVPFTTAPPKLPPATSHHGHHIHLGDQRPGAQHRWIKSKLSPQGFDYTRPRQATGLYNWLFIINIDLVE